MNPKMLLRAVIRGALFLRETETIPDGLERHKYHIQKKLDHRKVPISAVNEMLDALDIRPGDILMVHAAWRGMFGLDGRCEDVLKLLLHRLGPDGTLLMPAFGAKQDELDIVHTPSNAGVLSECFRKMPGVLRSTFPVGTVCAFGKRAQELLSTAGDSRYFYDEFSPYRRCMDAGGKVLLLGMGLRPHKVTAFHCATWSVRDEAALYKDVYTVPRTAKVTGEDGVTRAVPFLDRPPRCENDRNVFRRLFDAVPKRTWQKASVTAVSFLGADAFRTAREFCLGGGRLYLWK